MPLCPSCGSHDCEEIDEDTFGCNNCEYTFMFDGTNFDDQLVVIPDGDSEDMIMFEDRVSCIGDD